MAPSTNTPTSGGKAMSSRLLTMKFMQRAAASSPTTSSPTPDEPSAKRRKVAEASPSRSSVDALADQRAVQAAVAEEEAKRQAALERQGAEAGDTRWVLNFEDVRNSSPSSTTGLRIIQAGYANLDRPLPLHLKSTDSEDVFLDKPIVVGRKSFGKFNRVLEKQQNPSQDDSSDSKSDSEDAESEDESEDRDEDDSVTALIKASRVEAAQRAKTERKAKRKAEKAESLELAKKRKKKEVKLNNLTSLTGRQEKADMRTCHKCGGLGHLQKDCPKTKRVHQGGDDGPTRKSRRSR